ncbi:MAG: hypothetical protein ACT6SF_01320 [Hydrogenophaga sp.]|jgi:hypothetical protein|uniref:hypothetical protein n=1 Tax=Hydrogenophaga sp. TaxID=1904254 RepID=UPI001D74CCAB|nr:hypothetical protein [Hydrogenophaga sp.]MBW0168741.1 hypothetical protein [Hydrogenophaga sp.]MBW0183698.1 hypothetical protein [Hydrogenophaga sp.]
MHPIQRIAFAAVAWVAAASAWSQTPLDGSWRVTFATEGSEGREALVELKGGIGTWTTYPRGDRDRRDACVGRPFPIAIEGDPVKGLSLTLDAKAIPGCRDRKATLKSVDDKTLEGSFDNGRALKLARQ